MASSAVSPISHNQALEEFRNACLDAGLIVPGMPIMDGKLHMVAVEGARSTNNTSGRYLGHLDEVPSGWIKNWKTGEELRWKASAPTKTLTTAERAAHAAEIEKRRAREMQDRLRTEQRIAAWAQRKWEAARPVETHPYLQQKGVGSHGLRVDDKNCLLIPICDAEGKLWSLQQIPVSGEKHFTKGGRMLGLFSQIGDIEPGKPVAVAEGFATGATVHETTGLPVRIAFNSGNLEIVAKELRTQHPQLEILLGGDNDRHLEGREMGNVGAEKAAKSALAVGGYVVIPPFPPGSHGGDWNDFVKDRGKESASREIVQQLQAQNAHSVLRAMAIQGLNNQKEEKVLAQENQNATGWPSGPLKVEGSKTLEELIDIATKHNERGGEFLIYDNEYRSVARALKAHSDLAEAKEILEKQGQSLATQEKAGYRAGYAYDSLLSNLGLPRQAEVGSLPRMESDSVKQQFLQGFTSSVRGGGGEDELEHARRRADGEEVVQQMRAALNLPQRKIDPALTKKGAAAQSSDVWERIEMRLEKAEAVHAANGEWWKQRVENLTERIGAAEAALLKKQHPSIPKNQSDKVLRAHDLPAQPSAVPMRNRWEELAHQVGQWAGEAYGNAVQWLRPSASPAPTAVTTVAAEPTVVASFPEPAKAPLSEKKITARTWKAEANEIHHRLSALEAKLFPQNSVDMPLIHSPLQAADLLEARLAKVEASLGINAPAQARAEAPSLQQKDTERPRQEQKQSAQTQSSWKPEQLRDQQFYDGMQASVASRSQKLGRSLAVSR